MNAGKTTLEFRVGDLLLVEKYPDILGETEVTAVSQSAKAIQFDGRDWRLASEILPKIKGKIGRVSYKKRWFGVLEPKRIVDRV